MNAIKYGYKSLRCNSPLTDWNVEKFTTNHKSNEFLGKHTFTLKLRKKLESPNPSLYLKNFEKSPDSVLRTREVCRPRDAHCKKLKFIFPSFFDGDYS